MNELFIEFLKVSLGMILGGAVATPWKVFKAYNSTQQAIGGLEAKMEHLSSLLLLWERGFVEAKVRSERLERLTDEIDRRLLRVETVLEAWEVSRKNAE